MRTTSTVITNIFKPISFLKYSNKKTFTFNRMGLQHTMRIVFVIGLTSILMTNGLVDVGL